MSGPSRKLPPLVIEIHGDNSSAKKAFADTVAAAKDTAKQLGAYASKYAKTRDGEFQREFTAYAMLQRSKEIALKESLRRMSQLDKSARKQTQAEDKKSHQIARDEQAKAVKFFRTQARAMNTDGEKNYGRLTPAFKGMKGSKTTRGPGLDDLVKDAVKNRNATVRAEESITRKAMRDRERSVAESRRRIEAQSKATTRELEKDAKAEAAVRKTAYGEKLRRMKAENKAYREQVKQEDAKIKAAITVTEKESALMNKADNERRRSVEQSRKNIEAQAKAVHDEAEKEAKARTKVAEKAITSSLKQKEATAKTREAIQGYFKKQNDEMAKSDAAYSAKGKARRNAFWDDVQKGNQRAIKNHYAAEGAMTMATEKAARQRDRASRGRRTSASGSSENGGGTMGARADMYMHAGAIKSTIGMMIDFIKPWAMLEGYTAQIEIFTHSTAKAAEITARMQDFALISPYSLDAVMDATSLLMRYGTEADLASDIVEKLGDVAGGSSDKLKLLGLAFAQTNAMGRLQGQELRQMTEAGFNPLRVAAKHMAGPGADEKAIKKKMAMLGDLMRARRLDASFAEKALTVATAKGGDYEGYVEKAALTPIGLATQIMETGALMATTTVKQFDAELKAFLKTLRSNANAMLEWMKANKETVAWAAKLAFRIIMITLTFHALSYAIATAKWTTASLNAVYNVFGGTVGKLSMEILRQAAYYGLLGKAAKKAALEQSRSNKAAALATNVGKGGGPWLVFMRGIGVMGAKVAAIIAVIVAALVVFFAMGNKGGFTQVFQNIIDFGKFMVGFLYNIGTNMPKIFDFIGNNWRILLEDMGSTFVLYCKNMALMYWDLFTNQLPKMMELGTIEGWQKVLVQMLPGGGLIGLAKGIIDGNGGIGADAGKGDGSRKYDTSMFKTDMPAFDMLGFLDPFKKPDRIKTPHDVPAGLSFEDSILAEEAKNKKGGNLAASRDHAMVGSNEQAQRMWEYEQAMVGGTGVTTKDNAPMKQVALLEQIARNTQPDNSRGDMFEDADLD